MKLATNNPFSYILLLLVTSFLLFGATKTSNAQHTYVMMGDMAVFENRQMAVTLPVEHRSRNAGDYVVSEEDLFLGLRCMSDGLNIIVGHPFYIGRDKKTHVAIVIPGDSEAIGMEWEMTTDQKSSWMPMHMRRSFSRVFSQTSYIHLSVTDLFDGEVHMMRFSTRGWSRAVNAMACDW